MKTNIERTCLCGNEEFILSKAVTFRSASLPPTLIQEGYYPAVVDAYECTKCGLVILLKIADAGQYEWAKKKKDD